MFSKLTAFFLAVVLLVGSAFAQEDVKSAVTASSVAGLELPPDQTVGNDEGFLNIQAKCKGDVKWLVVAGVKVKYVNVPQTNSIIISVPTQGGVVSVFAVGLVDGKLTEFARTNITVNGSSPTPGPTPPGPNPGPNPPQNNSKLHVTFLIDLNNPTPELAKLLNSASLRTGINQRGHWFRRYDLKSAIVAQKKLDKVVQEVGGPAVMVIQADDGRVLDKRPIPGNEAEIFNIISQITGAR